MTRTLKAVLAGLMMVVAMMAAGCTREQTLDVRVVLPLNSEVTAGTEVRIGEFVVGEVLNSKLGADGRTLEADVRIHKEYHGRVFSPPETYAVVRRTRGLIPRTYVEIVNGGDKPVVSGAVLTGRSDIDVAIEKTAEAASEAADAAKRKLEAMTQNLSPEARAELEAAKQKADAAARQALKELESLATSTNQRLREYASSPEGQRYKAQFEAILKNLDPKTSGTVTQTSDAIQNLSVQAQKMMQDLNSIDRQKAAEHLDAVLREVEKAGSAIQQLSHGVVIDAVRGPGTPQPTAPAGS